MSESVPVVSATGTVVGTPDSSSASVVVNPATPAPQQPASEPAAPAVPASLDDLAPEALDELAARIEAARANRPQSVAKQLEQLQESLTQTHREKEAAVDSRRAASKHADSLEESIAEIKRSLRRAELAEAATVAEFAQPAIVAENLLDKSGEVSELIAAAAASGAYVLKTPAPSAPVGGPQSIPGQQIDPGIAALIREVNEAHGRV